jgi:hypothetical protein
VGKIKKTILKQVVHTVNTVLQRANGAVLTNRGNFGVALLTTVTTVLSEKRTVKNVENGMKKMVLLIV